MATKLHLLIIDPQNDFCDPKGSLYVKGADGDMERLGRLILRMKDRVEAIHVTLDTHHLSDVAHPIFWVDERGSHPEPFTIITVDDVEKGRWIPGNPAHRERVLRYVRSLAKNGRYPLCVWPPHCLIGSWGNNVYGPVHSALLEWEKSHAVVDYVVKGTNTWTEHYSAVQADVPDESDPTTLPNTRLIDALRTADIIAVAGEALSHCVANTVRDLADHMGKDSVRKLVLLSDGSSPVPGFEKEAEAFLREMTWRGMEMSKATDFDVEKREVA
ncbi:MAG: isochorismatase family protein [Deltaproteobacteria bacterium]|nr:isochorismatase family protein [Deltaproteobacteria bacterium]